MRRTVPWLGVLMMLASCATVPTPATENAPSPLPGRGSTSTPAPTGTSMPAGRPAVPSPMPGAPSTRRGGATAAQTPTVVDSLPSREALQVLKTIPEPLSPGERLAAPSRSALAADTTAESAADSSRAAAGPALADSSAAGSGARDSVQVPTPSPTVPLGDRPGSLVHPADTLATSTGAGAGGAGSSPPAGAATSPAMSPAPGKAAPSSVPADSCWRIQVAAKPEAARAEALRDAAQSQLLVPMVIEIEKGLHKVRSRDCLSAATAELLRHRALAAGFAGTFRFKGASR